MGPFGFSMTAVHRHNCLARAINTVSLEKEEEKKKKKRTRGKCGRAEGRIKQEYERILEIHSAYTYTIFDLKRNILSPCPPARRRLVSEMRE